jgi:Tfp pilus assembly protein PilE
MMKRLKKLRGFSLGELLVVIVIVTLLAIAIIMTYQTQVAKANDAKRKEDLNKYKIAFEDYYNDHNCYQTEEFWNNCTCGGNCLSPYMEKFLCDPTTRQKYYYKSITDADGNPDPCLGYQLYARLENSVDPDINGVGCSWIRGCGFDAPLSLYNYGIAVGGSLTAADFVPNPTPSSTPSPTPLGINFCLGDGSKKCNVKTGCAPDYGKRDCNEVLINEFGCRGFTNASECSSLCRADYDTYKCPATETLTCVSYKRCKEL